MAQVSSPNTEERFDKVLERYRCAVENVAKFFEDLGVEAHSEIVTGEQLRSFFLEARRDLRDVNPRFFMFRILDEHITSILSEYVASGHARFLIPIIVDKDYNIIAGYPILELVRENRESLDKALFVVYKTNLDMNNDVDFVKAVLIWLLTDYAAFARHVAPCIHRLEGREIKLGLEHLATILVLYVKSQIGDKVINELPPNARVLVYDMFEKILSDEAVMRRLGDLAEILRVIKHGRYIPSLSFVANLEPLLTFVEKRGKETLVKVAETVSPKKLEEAVIEVEKKPARAEEKEIRKREEVEVTEITEVPEVEERIEEEIETTPTVEVEEEVAKEEEEIEVVKPVLPKVDVWFTVGDDGVPKLCVKCPNCGHVKVERGRYSYDLDLEFRCPKCGHVETIPKTLLENKARLFVSSNVKARLEVIEVTTEGIRGRCPFCGYEIVTDESTYVNCGRCGLRLEIPADAFDKLHRVRSENPLEGTVLSLDAVSIVVKCPYCGHENRYTKLEQVLDGCRVTCKNCNYVFKIPEDAYAEWSRIRRGIEGMIKELYDSAISDDLDRLSDVTLRLTADAAKLETTSKLIIDVLGNFDRLKSLVSKLADKVEDLYKEYIELRRSGLEEEASKKLAEARKLYKIIEAITSKYGTMEFMHDYDRVILLLDPDKYIEDRLRTEIGDAYARFSREIHDLMHDIDDMLRKYEEAGVDAGTLLHVRRCLIDNVVALFSKLYSMLYSPRDVYGIRAELERERASLPEKLYSMVKTIIKAKDVELDTIVTAVSKTVNFTPIVLPLPDMLTTETKQISEHWKSRGINISQTVISTVAYMIGLAIVRRLTPDDITRLITMLDPAYGPDAALCYVMYKLLHGYPDVDEIVMRYLKVQKEKIELARELAGE